MKLMKVYITLHISTNFQQQQQKICCIKYPSSHLVVNVITSKHLSNYLCC